jgi:predicted NUDIX family NTP pyrophosphohydrolase
MDSDIFRKGNCNAKSGRLQAFPEIDRAEWFDLEAARSKILSGQIELIDRLEKEVT